MKKKEEKPEPGKPAKPAKPEPELKRPKKFPESPTYELLVKVLRRKIPLRVEAHRVDDIRHALRLAEEYDFSLILDKCTQGHLVADEIRKHKRNVPVIAGPVTTSFVNTTSLEYVEHDSASAAIMSSKGIQVAIGTSAQDGLGSKFLLPSAAIAVAGGMDPDMALRAITLTAAEILGVADRVGSIDVGKDADIVILSGGPLESFTQVEMVLIEGKKVYERKAAK
jgi:imidazolonepropionase-like amidohydrolase